MKKSFFTILLFLFTLPVFAKNTILIVGNSLSSGHGIERAQGWVTLLEKRLQEEGYAYEVVNASIAGDTTSNGLARLPASLAQYKPKLTLIELGGNDGLRGLALPLIKNNLEKMIHLAKASGSQVLLLGVRLPPNYGSAYVEQFQAIFVKLAEENALSVVPVFLKNVDDHPELMQSDRIHPTAEAQGILLNNVWPVLKPLL